MFVSELFKEITEGASTVSAFGYKPKIQVTDVGRSQIQHRHELPQFHPRFLEKIKLLSRFHHVPLYHDVDDDIWFTTKYSNAFLKDVQHVVASDNEHAYEKHL